MSDMPRVRAVAHADKEKALYTIIVAFAADPLTRWVLPQADRYLTYGIRIFDAFGGAAFAAGTAYEVSGFAGVALWVPPGHEDGDEAAQEAAQEVAQEVAQEGVWLASATHAPPLPSPLSLCAPRPSPP